MAVTGLEVSMQFGSSGVRVSGARRRISVLAGVAVAFAGCASAAQADYGEVARWGGATAAGAARVGLIDGFTADPVDDSVYTVDKQSADTTTGVSTFRVRKFAGATGALEATGTFTATGAVVTAPPSISSVAVDHANRHLYIGLVWTSAGGQAAVLQQIQVLGTQAVGGVLSAPADVADGTLLNSAPRLRGAGVITVDAASGDVLASGVHATLLAPTINRYRGTAVGGASPGDPNGVWTGVTATRAVYPTAVSVAADGTVYLATKSAATAHISTSVRTISADLATETPLMPTAAQGPQGTKYLATSTANTNTQGAFGPRTLGTQFAATADGTLLGSYGGGITGILGLTVADEPFNAEVSNLSFGVRRFAADGEDLGIVAGGGSSAGAACRIDNVVAGSTTFTAQSAYGFALGSNGKLFVPTWLPDNTVEIAVYGDGGSGCPAPAPSVAASTADGPLAVGARAPIGAEVTLDLSGSELRGWPVLEVDWDLDGDAHNGSERDGFETKLRRPTIDVDPAPAAPSLTVRRTWNAAGTYTVRARILTTGGAATISREIRVAAAPVPPTAALTGPAIGTAGTAVTFDASGSRPNPDGSAATLSYEWDFGDGGGAFAAGTARQTHTYAAAGTYAVRVRVTDASNGRTTVSATRTIVVKAADPRDPPRQDPPREDPPRQDPPRIDSPADTTPPAVAVRAATAIGSNGALTLQIGCPAGEASCSGRAELKTAAAVAASAAAKRTARAKRRVLALGSASFTVAGGRTAAVTLKLSAAGRRLLARAKRLKVVLTVLARDAAGNRTTVRRTLTLTVARARARGRARR
jgi:PKD repeat protein